MIAIGKAAIPMAEALLQAAENRVDQAIIVTNRENARPVAGAQVHAAGHPVPDAEGQRAALAVEALLQTATAADRVVALISGGGSALLPAPIEGVSLADKAAVSRLLLAGGFDIAQMNLVRQALSRLKGGGLLRVAAPAPVTAYILSDVIGDDLRVIASGLTVAPVGPRSQALHLLEKAGLWPHLPASVQEALARPDPTDPLPAATNVLIGSNRKSLDAVLAVAGDGAAIVDDALIGDVADAAKAVVSAAQSGSASCLVFGGETTVTLRGDGLGGRNQELALRVALTMPDLGRDWAFLSGGTDGRDGPTEAAGGLVDSGTSARIRAAGGDPPALLANNDSHRALALSGDLLITGGTGTNVADVQILLLAPRR
jgi:hydroxypyruvate reductase